MIRTFPQRNCLDVDEIHLRLAHLPRMARRRVYFVSKKAKGNILSCLVPFDALPSIAYSGHKANFGGGGGVELWHQFIISVFYPTIGKNLAKLLTQILG